MDTSVQNKFVVVKTQSGEFHANGFFENARIETNQTIEVSGDLSEVTASNLPALPNTGEWCEAGQMYNYNGEAVHCIQSHDRTIHAPSTIPALFSVYRPDTGSLNWIENELVQVGDIRLENGIEYECIQSHMTLVGWTPSTTPALWQMVQQNTVPNWVQPTGGNDAYSIGDHVIFNGNEYESLINGNVWSPTVYPAGWQLIN